MSWDQGVNNTTWHYGIPEFSLSSLFTYFDSLNEGAKSPLLAARKIGLYNQAATTAENIASSIDTDSKIKNSAKDFLLKVAISEQAKEKKALEKYKEKLKKALPEETELDDILKQFNADLFKDTEQLQSIYQRIIKYLTIIRKGATDYQNRLESFKHHQDVDGTLEALHHDDFRMRMKGELHAIENSVVGAATKAQKDSEEVYASLLRQAVGKYMVSRDILSKCETGEDIVAITTAITMDIEQYMDNELRKLKGTDLRNYTKKEIRTIVKDKLQAFSDNTDREETRLEKAINNNEQELQDILSAMKETLGIKIAGEKTRTQRANNYEKQKNKRDSIINKLVSESGGRLDDERLNQLFKITFTNTTSNTLHGNLFEALQVVLEEHATKVRGSAAVDVLTLGEINITPNLNFDIDTLMNEIRYIGNEFSNYALEQHENRFDSLTQRYNTLNERVKGATQRINTTLRQLEEQGIETEDIFIYHDSLKLYKTMESNKLGSTKFHGRDLQILSYIDELYSMSGIQELELIQKESLQFLALNIADEAAGAKQKNILADYFGTFAGILMFGDVQNIAEEAILQINQNATQTQAYNIHLYNLNGFYVPASMILFATYNALDTFDKELQKNWGASVYINTSAATNIINAWNDGEWRHGINKYKDKKKGILNPEFTKGMETYYSVNEWARVGEAISSATTVRIQFLAAFAEIIKQIP